MDRNDEKFFKEKMTFFDRLDSRQQEELLRNTAPAHFAAGSHVFSGDADCVGVLLIRKGQLRVYMLSEDGRDITLYRLFAGDICILSASCVLDAITFEVFIDAEEDTDVLRISSSAFRLLAGENVYMKNFAYELTTERFSRVMWAMQQILFMRIDRRIAIFLCEETKKSGSDCVNLTHEQIARYIGSAREVVSRMLKYFAGEGIVELYRGGIRIKDRKKLEAIAQ